MKTLASLAAVLALNGLALAQWSDDFNRADGPIGGNWNEVSGSWAIVSNQGSLASGLNVRMLHTVASAPYDTSVAKLDVFVNGTGLQYSGLIVGANGTDSILVKLQEQSSTGNFSNIGIYHQTSATGWGGFTGAGTSFAALTSPFPSARLTVYFSDPDTLVADVDTNFDGIADQSYTHAGVSAIAPNFGTGFGIGGYGSGTLFDNFDINGGGAPPIVTYCTAGTSTNGCLPSISANAQPSVSQANACVLAVANVEGQKSGLLFYGVDNTGFTPLPWASGSSSFLCLKPPTQRMIFQSSGGTVGQCDGALSQDFNAFLTAFPAALGQPFAAGGKVFAQAWYRDPPAVKTTNLSDALELTFAP